MYHNGNTYREKEKKNIIVVVVIIINILIIIIIISFIISFIWPKNPNDTERNLDKTFFLLFSFVQARRIENRTHHKKE